MRKTISDVRIGFIGCGNIADYHAGVLQDYGATIAAVAYRRNAERAKQFALKYSIGKIYSDWRTMMDTEGLDSVWVCASWDEIDKLLLPVLQYSIPTFFEKPVALSPERILQALQTRSCRSPSVQIGYNRRFYVVVDRLREYHTRYNILAIEVFIPEQVQDLSELEQGRFKPGFEGQVLHFFSHAFQRKDSQDASNLHSCLKLTRLCENLVTNDSGRLACEVSK